MKQRYDSYKPSGIDWIGEIPSHWENTKLKFYISIDSGDSLSKDCISDESAFPVFGGGELIGYTSSFNVEGNSIIIGRVGARCGCITPILNHAWATDNSLVCKPKQDFRFFTYLLTCANLNRLNESNAQPLITATKVKNLGIALPPIKEQEAIAAWLDEKCGEIDGAIAKVDREIELIDELKQSEISRVVTRGLNPDAPLRPSGIDWIGDVPEHWEITKVKYTGKPEGGLSYTPNDVCGEEGILVLRASNIQNQQFAFNDNVYVKTTPDALMIKKGDIIICATNGSANLVGKAAYVDEIFTACFGAFMMRFRTHMHSKFIFYLLSFTIPHYKGEYVTVTINQLSKSILNNMRICLPPLSEQQAIADYLDKKCAEIDGLKEKLVKKRETLKELRQAIISEVVTGKRKVI